jgi:tetratricopeptide (TPR) repeat protein
MSEVTFEQIMDYSPENKAVFNDLVDMCARRQIVPYIGAGMSVFARYVPILQDRHLFPTWEDLIKIKYYASFPSKQMPKNLMVAAEEIGDEIYKYAHLTMGGDLKEEEWSEILEEAENQAISVIPKLFYGPIVTTNYDQIIEKIYKKDVLVFLPNRFYGFERALYNRIGLVYKIHGCVSDPQNIILTKSAYGNVYKRNSELVQSLITFFQTFQFLFLGCRLDVVTEEDKTKGREDKTKERYMELWERLLNSGTRHFTIINCPEKQLAERRKELENRNIYPIFYNSEIDKEHISVRIILDKLLENIEKSSPNFLHNEIPYIDREEGKYDFDLGFGNIQLANYDRASEHIEKSIATLELYHREAIIAGNIPKATIIANNLLKSYINIGITNISKTNYKKAIEDFDRCINLGKQMRVEGRLFSEGKLARAYLNRGVAYEYINEHKKALLDKNKSIEIWERMKDEVENNLATAYMNRGVSYNSLTEYEEAQDNFKKSIEIWKRIKDENKWIDENHYASALMLMNNKLQKNSCFDYSKSDLVKAIISNRK